MNNAFLYRLQKRSAIIFALFLALHLSNAAALLLGPDAFDQFQGVAHSLYGHLIVEIILLAAVLAHTGTALVLWYRRPARAPRSLAMQLQTWAGFTILLFIPGHVFFTRIAAQAFGYTADFHYLSVTAHIWPTFFVPYYMAFGSAGSFHLLHGLQRFMTRGKLGWPHYVVYGTAIAVMMAAGIAIVATKPLREPTDEELRKYLSGFELVTPWLIDMADENPRILRYQELKAKPPSP